MKISLIVMIGRRWFDGTSTYHTTEVIVYSKTGGLHTGKTEMTNGYGDGYIQSGVEYLVANGLMPELDRATVFWRWCEDNKIKKVCTVVDVQRKKDL